MAKDFIILYLIYFSQERTAYFESSVVTDSYSPILSKEMSLQKNYHNLHKS